MGTTEVDNICIQEEQVLLESRRSSHSEASPSFDAEAAAAAAMAAETAGEEQTGLLGLEAAAEHVVEVGINAGLDLIDAGLHLSSNVIICSCKFWQQ